MFIRPVFSWEYKKKQWNNIQPNPNSCVHIVPNVSIIIHTPQSVLTKMFGFCYECTFPCRWTHQHVVHKRRRANRAHRVSNVRRYHVANNNYLCLLSSSSEMFVILWPVFVIPRASLPPHYADAHSAPYVHTTHTHTHVFPRESVRTFLGLCQRGRGRLYAGLAICKSSG